MCVPVAFSFTENAGVEKMPHGHMTAMADLLNVPIMLEKNTPIWCTDFKEMVSTVKMIYDVFASIVKLTNNQALCFSCSERECKDYSSLNTLDRGASFTTSDSNPLCDENLPSGWYRFLSPAGDRMASECVPSRRCGTAVTGWLSTSHPKMTDGIVDGTVCFNWKKMSNCCQFPQTIKVRNCGRFFVYKLAPTKECPMRFCAATKVNSSSLHFYAFCTYVN